MNNNVHEVKRDGLGRRQVLQATAWSAPVIAVAVAAPRAAASGLTMVALQPFTATGITTDATSTTLDRSLIAINGASSAQVNPENSPAANVNDGDPATKWHTQYSPAIPVPTGGHWIQLEAPAAYLLTGLEYTPRLGIADGDYNGVANSYRVVGSNDAAFTTPIELASGTWAKNKNLKTATFPAASLRFIRLCILTQHGTPPANAFATAAEIRLRGYARGASNIRSFEGTAALANQSVDASASVTNATLTITVPSAGLSTTLVPTFTGAGWTFGGVAASGGSRVYTFNFAGTVAAGSSSSTLAYSLKGDGSPTGGALPKTANGVLSGPDFGTVTNSTTWN